MANSNESWCDFHCLVYFWIGYNMLHMSLFLGSIYTKLLAIAMQKSVANIAKEWVLRRYRKCQELCKRNLNISRYLCSYEWSLRMIRKFYPRVTFPGDQWYLRDIVLADGRKAFTFNSFLKANIDK